MSVSSTFDLPVSSNTCCIICYLSVKYIDINCSVGPVLPERTLSSDMHTLKINQKTKIFAETGSALDSTEIGKIKVSLLN